MPKKIGFSAGNCIRDILYGKVDYDNVVFIITSTKSNTKEEWIQIMQMYNAGRDFGKVWPEEQIIELVSKLWDEGKIHQPRNFGIHRGRYQYTWMDLVHTKSEREEDERLKKSWEELQIFETLITESGIDLDE